MRYGNPLQVELNKAESIAKNMKKKANKRRIYSTEGTCSVNECGKPIKARRLCAMHHNRMRRTGSLETTRMKNGSIETCLVIGCSKPHKSYGYCDTHSKYYQQNGTPYLAKVIKLCGVVGCEDKHWGKGMCKKHFVEWKKVLRQNKLDQ